MIYLKLRRLPVVYISVLLLLARIFPHLIPITLVRFERVCEAIIFFCCVSSLFGRYPLILSRRYAPGAFSLPSIRACSSSAVFHFIFPLVSFLATGVRPRLQYQRIGSKPVVFRPMEKPSYSHFHFVSFCCAIIHPARSLLSSSLSSATLASFSAAAAATGFSGGSSPAAKNKSTTGTSLALASS